MHRHACVVWTLSALVMAFDHTIKTPIDWCDGLMVHYLFNKWKAKTAFAHLRKRRKIEWEKQNLESKTHLLLLVNGLSPCSSTPSWNHSTVSEPVPAIEQLKMAVPPELTICTCGCMCTDRYVLTCKRISTRCSPNWFDALQTCNKNNNNNNHQRHF